MTAKGTEIAGQLRSLADEICVTVRSMSESEWHTLVPGEDWTVGVVIHHIAEGAELARGWLVRATSGQPIEDTRADIDAENARHAQSSSAVSVDEALTDLRANCERTATLIEGLTDEQFAESTPFGPADGAPVTVEMIAQLPLSHCRGHFQSVQSAIKAS
jgi:hypothetical protein